MTETYNISLNTLAADIHAENVRAGWWDNWPVRETRHETAMMLVISELAEAMEGDRKALWDDHLRTRRMFEVELADTLIRLLDLAGAYGMDLRITKADVQHALPEASKRTVPEQLLMVVTRMLAFRMPTAQVATGIFWVCVLSQHHDVDLFKIVEEKRAYNARRADHKRESRARENGKAY